MASNVEGGVEVVTSLWSARGLTPGGIWTGVVPNVCSLDVSDVIFLVCFPLLGVLDIVGNASPVTTVPT